MYLAGQAEEGGCLIMINIYETRGLPNNCECGRFYIRRKFIASAETKEYRSPKGGRTFYRPSVEHPDGLCERCAKYGRPAYAILNHVGDAIKGTMRRSESHYKKLRLEAVEEVTR